MMKLKCGMVILINWNWLDKTLNTPNDADIGCFLEVDLKYPDDIKEKTKHFPFCPEKKNYSL